MNKKLPEVYHNTENIFSNNKNTYISFSEKKDISTNLEEPITKEEKQEIKNDINFFNYFNKSIKITTIDNEILNTKILSKLDNKLLLANGVYLDVDKIKFIN